MLIVQQSTADEEFKSYAVLFSWNMFSHTIQNKKDDLFSIVGFHPSIEHRVWPWRFQSVFDHTIDHSCIEISGSDTASASVRASLLVAGTRDVLTPECLDFDGS
jgi:hypothetical protein